MGIAPKASNSATFASPGSPQSVTLTGYTSALGDCLVVEIATSAAPAVGVSGCGATWVSVTEGTAPELSLFVGYGATAGGTTISITGVGGITTSVIWSAWSGVRSSSSPVGIPQVGAAASAGTITTGTLTYEAGQLVIGCACAGSGTVTFGSPTWSDGNSNTNLGNVVTPGKSATLDYEIPSTSATTTYTAPLVSSTQTLRALTVTLAPAAAFFQPYSLSVQFAVSDFVWANPATSWTDITKYVTKVTTTMGRQHELQQVNPSTAVIELNNEPAGPNDPGGRFSPWNTLSPYSGSLTPGHPIRIQATIGATTYNVFYGYTQSWIPKYGQSRSSVTLNCYDGMALLNLAMMDQNLYEPQVITDGAMGYWECQDPVDSHLFADSSGNGNGGTLVGSGTFGGTAGALRAIGDGCVVLGGTHGAFGVMLTPVGPTATSHVQFEGWFQTTGKSQTLMSWAVGQTAGNIEAVSLCLDSTGTPVIASGSTASPVPATQTVVTGGNVTNDGSWHHYVVTVPCTDSTGTYTLYVDGLLQGSGRAGSAFAWTGVSTSNFVAGGYWLDDNGLVHLKAALTGSMDQVAYYTSPLSAAQIANHYQIGSAGFVVQDSGARTQAVLEDIAGIPSGLVNCDTGVVNLQGATSSLTQTTASSYLQQVVNTERGILYQDATGVFQFKNRWHVYTNSASETSQFTFTYHGGGEYFYSTGLSPQEDDTDLWNDFNVGRQGGTVQNVNSSTSIADYGRRSLQGYTSLLFENDSDALDLAMGLRAQYQFPAPRVRTITTSSIINGGSALPYVLALNLLDRITIIFNPIDGSTVDFSQQSLVEQVQHVITPGQWDTTLSVTPIGTETFGKWGSALWGFSPGWGF